MLGWVAFGLRVTTLADYLTVTAPTPGRSVVVAVDIAEAAAALVAAIILSTLAAHAMRSRSKAPPGPTAR